MSWHLTDKMHPVMYNWGQFNTVIPQDSTLLPGELTKIRVSVVTAP